MVVGVPEWEEEEWEAEKAAPAAQGFTAQQKRSIANTPYVNRC